MASPNEIFFEKNQVCEVAPTIFQFMNLSFFWLENDRLIFSRFQPFTSKINKEFHLFSRGFYLEVKFVVYFACKQQKSAKNQAVIFQPKNFSLTRWRRGCSRARATFDFLKSLENEHIIY